MTPLLETMAKQALLARIERLETSLKGQAQVIASLTLALWHHLQDRHDAAVGTDDAVDIVHTRNARRTFLRLTNSNDVRDVARAEGARGKHPPRRPSAT